MGVTMIIAWVVVAIVAAYALTIKPPKPPDAVAGKFQAPTAQSGREIPVVFGTRDIVAPNIVWYGDVSTEAIEAEGGKK